MEVAPNPLGSAVPLESPWASSANAWGSVANIREAARHSRRPIWLLAAEREPHTLSCFEIVVALIGLVVGPPLILIASVIVRLDSPGTALFRHRRPARSVCIRGRDLVGRPDLVPPPGGYRLDAQYYVPSYFTLVKLRTMYTDARTRFPAYYAYRFSQENFHSQFPTSATIPASRERDGLLRRLSIDELPNLWSVVKGDMALVGPRPEAPEVLQYYTAGRNGEIHAEAGDYGSCTDRRKGAAQLGRNHRIGSRIR